MSEAFAEQPGPSLHMASQKAWSRGGREKLETRNWKLEIGKAESGHDPYGVEEGGARKGGGEALRNGLECLECGVRRLAMAHRFTVIFEKEAEGGYHVFCPTLPGCHTQSETVEEGVENIRQAIELYIETLVEDGLPIPTEDILIKPIEISA